jgi:hypothetical protein
MMPYYSLIGSATQPKEIKMNLQQAAYNLVLNEGGEGFVPSDDVFNARAEDVALLADEKALLRRTEERAAYGDFSAIVSVKSIKARIAAIEQRLAA